jgi:RNA-directed DNA polymerase
MYLNKLDQFVKRQLQCRYYIRYCDDMVLVDPSPDRLAAWRQEIEGFLWDKLLLNPNPQQDRLRPVSSGIDFLGYIVRRRYVLVRRRVVNHLKEKLEWFASRMSERPVVRLKAHLPPDRDRVGAPSGARHGMDGIAAWHYPPMVLRALRATTASYLGHFAWADAHNLVKGLFMDYPVLRAAFILREGRIIPRYLPAGKGRNIRAAYREWVPDAGPGPVSSDRLVHPLWTAKGPDSDVLVFFPVGRFYEFYGPQSDLAQRVLGLRPVTGLRGFREGCGFHRRRLRTFVMMAFGSGIYVALLRAERGLDGSANRRLARLFAAAAG